jgi:hypothetical protein
VSSFSACSVALAAVSPAPTFWRSPSAVPPSPLQFRSAFAVISRFRYAVGLMSRKYSPSPTFLPKASASAGCAPLAFSFGRPLPLRRVPGVGQVRRFFAAARRGRRLASADFSPSAVACGGGASSLSAVRCSAFRVALTLALRSLSVAASARPNPAVDPVPFGHWTLRDEAAQRRSPLRSPIMSA